MKPPVVRKKLFASYFILQRAQQQQSTSPGAADRARRVGTQREGAGGAGSRERRGRGEPEGGRSERSFLEKP